MTTHPLRNDNPFKLGVFGANINGGAVMTTAEGTVRGRWAQQPAIAQAADAAGLEFLLPVARWKGLDGPSDFAGESMEVFTWAAALAAITEQISVFATAHVPIYHPLLAAKQGATIDDVAGGRFGLNVVAGWNSDEFDMFRIEQRPHDERYAAAGEWVEIVRQLWSQESVTYKGAHLEVSAASLRPRPVVDPVFLNAGQSDSGIRFAAQHMDYTLLAYPGDEAFAANVVKARTLARREFGRELGLLTFGTIICADTEREAQDYFHHYVDELGDFEAGAQLVRQLVAGDNQSMSKEWFEMMRRSLVATWAGIPFVGTAEQIAERIQGLHAQGVAGLALTFVDYEQGLGRFVEQILPLLEQAGLRHPHVPAGAAR